MTDKAKLSRRAGAVPELYSYSRVSTQEQLKGSGKKQQEESLKMSELSKRYDLPVSDKVFEDDGKSAFHGKNLEGSLGRFIAAVDTGEVAKGSILAVFSLDRISRQSIIDAQAVFMSLLKKGIKIYTAIDDKLYGDDPSSHFTDLIMSMVYLERAHNESLHKSERTIQNAKLKIKEHLDGKRSPNGFAYSIESVGNHVWWVTTDPKTREVIPRPKYFEVAKVICDKIFQGWGTHKILKFLDEQVEKGEFPQPRGRKNKKIKGWAYWTIANIHKNGALKGERILNVGGSSYTLKDYYPPILSPEKFRELCVLREERNAPKGSTQRANFITGIEIAHCRMCGGPVGSFVNRFDNISYRCLGRGQRLKKKSGDICPGWSVTGGELEKLLLEKCRLEFLKIIGRELHEKGEEEVDFDKELEDLNKQKSNLIQLVKNLGVNIPEISLELTEISEREKEIQKLQKKALSKMFTHTEELKEKWKSLSKDALVPTNYDARINVRDLMQRSLSRLDIKPISKNGRKRVFIAIGKFRGSEHSFRFFFSPSVENEWVFLRKGEERDQAIDEYYSKRNKQRPDSLKG